MSDDEREDDDDDLPFFRWLIKLIVVKHGDKIFDRLVFPAVVAAGVSGGGWYSVGQYQVQDKVKKEVETRERVRELVDEAVKPHPLIPIPEVAPVVSEISMEELEARWRELYGPAGESPGADDGGPPPNQQIQFPKELVNEELHKRAKH